MLKRSWWEAMAHWDRLERDGALVDIDDFHAYARCCEVLGDWMRHERVVTAGLLGHPGNAGLQARRRYREAVESFQKRQWHSAHRQFEALLGEKPGSWPFSLSYYRWQSLYRSRLETGDMSLSELTAAVYFKNARILARQLAGLDCLIEALDWSPEIRSAFLSIHWALVDVFKHHDHALSDLRDAHTAACVNDLAAFLKAHRHLSADIPSAYLYFIARLLLQHGHAELYQACRAEFVERLAGSRERAPAGLVEHLFQLTHANESGDAMTLAQVRPEATGFDKLVLERVLTLSELYRPESQADAYYRMLDDSMGGAFAAMVQGRSVAIVGMADVGLDHGPEIDSFDVIIRFNWHPEVHLGAERFGCRCDISYYGSSNLNAYRAYLESAFDLRCAVLEEFDTERFAWLRNLSIPAREQPRGWSYDSPFLFGAPTAVQRVLMDVLRFRPSRVKIFNTNLYLDIVYPPEYNTSNVNMFPAFSVHDPLSNFIFTRQCVKGWGVEIDEVLERILDLSADDYLKRLWQGNRSFVK